MRCFCWEKAAVQLVQEKNPDDDRNSFTSPFCDEEPAPNHAQREWVLSSLSREMPGDLADVPEEASPLLGGEPKDVWRQTPRTWHRRR
ncbi:hypothetical protein RRG08_059952 [Elysia crispata]|uniref:Uncharacterized protein n=1 Tax=Elysia crispata TaxID=231223 RepID=A0AAE0Y6M3_9GAST|nr:hypothetical protein RRG08_059952 [Elysia crispata]